MQIRTSDSSSVHDAARVTNNFWLIDWLIDCISWEHCGDQGACHRKKNGWIRGQNALKCEQNWHWTQYIWRVVAPPVGEWVSELVHGAVKQEVSMQSQRNRNVFKKPANVQTVHLHTKRQGRSQDFCLGVQPSPFPPLLFPPLFLSFPSFPSLPFPSPNPAISLGAVRRRAPLTALEMHISFVCMQIHDLENSE